MRKVPIFNINQDLKIGDKIKLPKEYAVWYKDRVGCECHELGDSDKGELTVKNIDRNIWDINSWVSVKEDTGHRYLIQCVEKVK